jgi:hypothetical protein
MPASLQSGMSGVDKVEKTAAAQRYIKLVSEVLTNVLIKQ